MFILLNNFEPAETLNLHLLDAREAVQAHHEANLCLWIDIE